MHKCPSCSMPNNIYLTACQHCGGPLVAAERPPGQDPGPQPQPVRAPCPKCDSRRFLVVYPFSLPDCERGGSHTMPVVCGSTRDAREVKCGMFRVHVCAQCGFTEWYANDLKGLLSLAGQVNKVRLVQVPDTDPYR